MRRPARIHDGTLLDHLAELHAHVPHYLDLSLYDAGELRTILKVFAAMSDDIDAERKLGVVNNGIALCLAYCIPAIDSPDVYSDYRFDE